MNSNKTAIAVAVLACAVIGSSLWISSRTEPSSAPAFGEQEQNTESAETESAEADSSSAVSDVLSDTLVSEESEAANGVSDEVTDEPSAEEPVTSVPESSETGDEVREPLANVTEEKFSLTVRVTDEEGYPIEGAVVSVDDLLGQTNENGNFYAETIEETFVLHIVSEAYVSYYEELNLYECGSELVISLEKADKIRRLINSAELHPYVAYDTELDAALNELLDTVIEPGMDTYDQVKACYDWVIANMEYKRPHHEGSGYWSCALQAIEDGIGTCNCYSAVFAAMMRYIGLDCSIVEGSTAANGGGMTGHYWTVILLEGDYYIFDPQVEDAMANRTSSKEVTYVRFCLPEPHSKYVYSVRSEKRCIEKFEAFLLENGYFAELPEEPEIPEAVDDPEPEPAVVITPKDGTERKPAGTDPFELLEN